MDKLLHAIFSKAGAWTSGGSLIAVLLGIMINFDIQTDKRIDELEKEVQKLNWQIEMLVARGEDG